MYGTELVYDENKTQGLTRVMIITAYFDGNALVGNRSTWYINSLDAKATLKSLSTWTADVKRRESLHMDLAADERPTKPTWVDANKRMAWAKHRKTLSKFLMERWKLGKLHGRISDILV